MSDQLLSWPDILSERVLKIIILPVDIPDKQACIQEAQVQYFTSLHRVDLTYLECTPASE